VKKILTKVTIVTGFTIRDDREKAAHNNRIAKSGAEEYIIICISLSAAVRA